MRREGNEGGSFLVAIIVFVLRSKVLRFSDKAFKQIIESETEYGKWDAIALMAIALGIIGYLIIRDHQKTGPDLK